MQDWIEKLGQWWADRDPRKVMSLFDKLELEFYESAIDEPIREWGEVKKLWDVVPANQKNVTFRSNILCEKDNCAIINWIVTRHFIPTNKNQEINGIFEIKLNSSGKCTYFKQWRSTKEL